MPISRHQAGWTRFECEKFENQTDYNLAELLRIDRQVPISCNFQGCSRTRFFNYDQENI